MAILPLDILTLEILPRLPPKTLLRFKLVNKFFYNHISSKEFINHHLQYSVSWNPSYPIIVFDSVRDEQRCLYMLDAEIGDSSFPHIHLPPQFSSLKKDLKVVGSCRGLLCLKSFNLGRRTDDWIILNPYTGEFGYDSLNDDYKLVLLEPPYNYSDKVSVFSVKADSWRYIENNSDIDLTIIQSKVSNCEVIDDYLLHWLWTDYSGKQTKRRIVCFNLRNEQWGADVALPDLDDNKHRYGHLRTLEGCLCYLCYNDVNTNAELKSHGRNFPLTFLIIVILVLWSPREHLKSCLKERSGVVKKNFLVWYNIRDKTSKKVEVSGSLCNLRVKSLCPRSLVSGFGTMRVKIDNHIEANNRHMEGYYIGW
ncbi:hypothetical protein RDABS01_037392 [Bienertia sinuspersici]